MTAKELFLNIKQQRIPDNLEINDVAGAVNLHDKVFIPFRVNLFENGLNGFMPHYRGEQKNGWDILPGIFRPPLTLSNVDGKKLEERAAKEFEEVVETKIGSNILRKIFNAEKYGKTWDLLFQAQHAGVRTSLTDWTAFIVSALFFATEKSIYEDIEKSDAQLWCQMVPEENIISDSQFFPKESMYNLNPFNVDNVYLINPSIYIDNVEERLFEYNMYKQKGRFLILPNDICHVPINKQDIFKDFLIHIKIKAENKESIREDLAARDITRENLFYKENKDCEELIREINKKVYNI